MPAPIKDKTSDSFQNTLSHYNVSEKTKNLQLDYNAGRRILIRIERTRSPDSAVGIPLCHNSHFCSARSRCSPGGSSAYSSRCSGRNGVDTACSSPSHFPRSISLQRCEQNGPYAPANHSPSFLQLGHFTACFIRQYNTSDVSWGPPRGAESPCEIAEHCGTTTEPR